jgi:hypothetical protein
LSFVEALEEVRWTFTKYLIAHIFETTLIRLTSRNIKSISLISLHIHKSTRTLGLLIDGLNIILCKNLYNLIVMRCLIYYYHFINRSMLIKELTSFSFFIRSLNVHIIRYLKNNRWNLFLLYSWNLVIW